MAHNKLNTAIHNAYCTSLHCTALYCTAVHCTALHCSALHCTAVHCPALHCTALHCSALHCIALYCTILLRTKLHSTPLNYIELICPLHYTLYCTAQHCTVLHCTALHCTALHNCQNRAQTHSHFPTKTKTVPHSTSPILMMVNFKDLVDKHLNTLIRVVGYLEGTPDTTRD